MRRWFLLLGALAGCAHAPAARVEPAAPAESGGRLLAAEPVVFGPGEELVSDVSSDERYVLYTAAVAGNLDVWVRDTELQRSLPLTLHPSDDFDACLSPDGHYIAFVSRRADAKGDIFVRPTFAVSDRGLRRLTGPESGDRQPRFSADGRHLYFTTHVGAGPEYIARLSLSSGQMERVSPGPGSDPALSPDGRLLAYAPGGRVPPLRAHASGGIDLIELASGASRRLPTPGPAAAPAFFASRTGGAHLYFSAFVLDDNRDGARDAQDLGALYRVEYPADAPLAVMAAHHPELVAVGEEGVWGVVPRSGGLYFSAGVGQKDVHRLPRAGAVALPDDGQRAYAARVDVPQGRSRWLYLGALRDRLAPRTALWCETTYSMGRQFVADRPDLAERSFRELAIGAPFAAGTPCQSLRGRSQVMRHRLRRGAPARGTREALPSLEAIGRAHAGDETVKAHLAFERAERAWRAGDRPAAIKWLGALHEGAPEELRAEAAVRRVAWSAVEGEAETLLSAYDRVFQKIGPRPRLAEAAAEDVAARRLGALAPGATWQMQADALRRLMALLSPSSVLRARLHWRLIDVLVRAEQTAALRLELERIARDAHRPSPDRAAAYARWAALEEAAERLDEAIGAWQGLKALGASTRAPGRQAQAEVFRLSLKKATAAERVAAWPVAWQAYRTVVEGGRGSPTAIRRYAALSAKLGREADFARYARRAVERTQSASAWYALALTKAWQRPPDFAGARSAVDRSIALNPRFAEAYLLRGWLHEMRDLAPTPWGERLGRYLLAPFAWLVESFLTIDAPEAAGLEQAIEDYQLALQLSEGTVDARGRAEIQLNLGNARYRLGDETKDVANFEAAYTQYRAVRASSALLFLAPQAELVFLERFGRSASWAGHWSEAISITKAAQALSQRLPGAPRSAQLKANLALATLQSGDAAAAEAAFAEYAETLSTPDEASALAIALREQARALLGRDEWRPADAARVRQLLVRAEQAVDQAEDLLGSAPDIWRPIGPGRSQFQFGLALDDERGALAALRAALEERTGHRAAARQASAKQRRLWTRRWENAPKVLLVPRWAVTRSMVQERLGLDVQGARDALRRGEVQDAHAALAEAAAWLEAVRTRPEMEAEAPGLAIDAWRLLAVRGEACLLAVREGRSEGQKAATATVARSASDAGCGAIRSDIDDAIAEAEAARTAVLEVADAAPAVAHPWHTWTSSSAEAWSSALSVRPASEGADLAAVIGRLYWLRGSLRASGTGAPAPSRFELWLGGGRALDPSARTKLYALDDFRRAGAHALRATVRDGAPVVALALDGLAAAWRGVDPGRASELAAARARFGGRVGLEGGPSVWAAPAVADAPPMLWGRGPSVRAGRRQVVRKIARALAAGRLVEVFKEWDRWLLARSAAFALGAAGPVMPPSERDLVAQMQTLWQRRTRLLAEVSADGKALAEVQRELSDRVEQLRTPAARARYAAESVGLGAVQAALRPHEAMVLAVPDEARAHLLVVTSTAVRQHPLPNAPAAAALAPMLRAILPERTTTGLWVDAGVFPRLRIQQAAPDWAWSELSAPSTLALAREARVFGGTGVLALRTVGAPGDDEATVLGAAELRRMYRIRSEVVPPSDYEARTASELVTHRRFQMVSVEAPLTLAPCRAVQSRLRLGPAVALSLRQLAVPAPILWVDGFEPAAIGACDDQAMAWDWGGIEAGYATSIWVPRDVSPEARRAFRLTFLERLSTRSPAAAFAESLRALGPRWPALWSARLAGDPGETPDDTPREAQLAVRSVRRMASKLARRGAFADLVPVLWRWVEAARQSADRRGAETALKTLVEVLSRRLNPPDYAQAADAQWMWLLDGADAGWRPEKTARAEAKLGWLLARAGAKKMAEGAYGRALAAAKDTPALRADLLGEAAAFYRDFLRDYRRAESAYREAVALHRAADAFRSPKTVASATQSLLRLGHLYLRRMSAPEQAERMYREARTYVADVADRVAIDLDLARAARQRAAFDEAGRYAGRAAQAAASVPELQIALMAARTEAANIAWYQGRYRAGASLCQAAVALATTHLADLSAGRTSVPKKLRRREARRAEAQRIYAQSACGLIFMSSGDRARALSYLMAAKEAADSAGLRSEVAAQLNNIGRVHLEFGDEASARASFEEAYEIDEALGDRYALAYDLRNLGDAQLRLANHDAARDTLARALALTREVNDANNELRTQYALARLALIEGREADADVAIRAAQPLAERLRARDLIWQLHELEGTVARRRGQFDRAETALQTAVRAARRVSGAERGDQASAFERLASLHAARGEWAKALDVFSSLRALRHLEWAEDERMPWTPALRRALERVRVGKKGAEAELRALHPALAARTSTASSQAVAEIVPPSERILVHWVAEEGVFVFVLADRKVHGAFVRVPAERVKASVAAYLRAMVDRTDPSPAIEALSRWLLDPIRRQLAGAARVTWIRDRGLAPVSLAALRCGAEQCVDRFAVAHALDLGAARRAMAIKVAPRLTAPRVVTSGGGGLWFAEREARYVYESLGRRPPRGAAQMARSVFVRALRDARPLHFSGHATTGAIDDYGRVDAHGGGLVFRDGWLGPAEIAGAMQKVQTPMVFLSACGPARAVRPGDVTVPALGRPTPEAWTDGLGLAFATAGVPALVRSHARIDDLAAALVVKHFYRAKDPRPAYALRRAQQMVRSRHPHPAWWAGFGVWLGQSPAAGAVGRRPVEQKEGRAQTVKDHSRESHIGDADGAAALVAKVADDADGGP